MLQNNIYIMRSITEINAIGFHIDISISVTNVGVMFWRPKAYASGFKLHFKHIWDVQNSDKKFRAYILDILWAHKVVSPKTDIFRVVCKKDKEKSNT